MNNVISISEVDVKYAYIIELTNYVKYRKKGIQDIFNFFPQKKESDGCAPGRQSHISQNPNNPEVNHLVPNLLSWSINT